MLTDRNINEPKYTETNSQHKSNNNMITTQTKRKGKKQTKKQTKLKWNMTQSSVYIMYSSDSKQRKKFDEVCCVLCKNVGSCEIISKDFIQQGYYGSMLSSLFLHSL